MFTNVSFLVNGSMSQGYIIRKSCGQLWPSWTHRHPRQGTKQFLCSLLSLCQFVDTTSDGNNFIFVVSILSFVVCYFRHLYPPHKVKGVSDHEILNIPGRNSQGLQNVYQDKYISPLLLTLSHSKTLGVLTRILACVFASKLSQQRPNDLFMLKITESPVASSLNSIKCIEWLKILKNPDSIMVWFTGPSEVTEDLDSSWNRHTIV